MNILTGRGSGRTRAQIGKLIGCVIAGFDALWIYRNYPYETSIICEILDPFGDKFELFMHTRILRYRPNGHQLRMLSQEQIMKSDNIKAMRPFVFDYDHDILLDHEQYLFLKQKGTKV